MGLHDFDGHPRGDSEEQGEEGSRGGPGDGFQRRHRLRRLEELPELHGVDSEVLGPPPQGGGLARGARGGGEAPRRGAASALRWAVLLVRGQTSAGGGGPARRGGEEGDGGAGGEGLRVREGETVRRQDSERVGSLVHVPLRAGGGAHEQQGGEGVEGECGSEEDHGLLQEREGHLDLRDRDDGAGVVEAAGQRPIPDTGRDPLTRMGQQLNTYHRFTPWELHAESEIKGPSW